jgi:hypothetical protein
MAYSFNGTNQAITAAVAGVTAEPLTIAAWFYPTRNTARTVIVSLCDTTGGGAGDQMFYGLVEDGTVAGDPICATKHNGGGLSAVVAEAVSTSGFSTNTWAHGCAVFTSTTSRTVYLNGGSSATNTTNVSTNANTVDKTAIGCLGRATNVAFFQGRVAEVGIWSVALTAEEVASLADGMTCDKVRPSALVFCAPIIRNIQDLRQAVTLTNNNTATVAEHPRVYA